MIFPYASTRSKKSLLMTATAMAAPCLASPVYGQTANQTANLQPSFQVAALGSQDEPSPNGQQQAPVISAVDSETPATKGPAEIVVTARRQQESLQDVPLNITAYGSDAIEDLAIDNLVDLMMATPGFSYGDAGSRQSGRVTMRGLGVSTTGANKVSFFLDGTYIAGDYTGISLAGLERVEVLKGPQSVAFGRATFAGAINYVTRDGGDFMGGASLEAGSFGEVRADAYVSTPIIDDILYGLVSVNYYEFDGPADWRDASDGSRHGAQNSQSFLGKLRFTPAENLSITGLISYNESDDGPATALFIDPASRNGSFKKINPITGQPTGAVARYPVGGIPTFSPEPGDYAFFHDYLTNVGDRLEQWRTQLQLSWAIGGGHDLSILAAHNHMQTDNQGNGFLRGRPPFGFVANAYAYQTTADDSLEVRFASPQNEPFRYTLGAYYLDLRVRPGEGGVATTYLPTTNSATDLISVGALGLNQNISRAVFAALYIDPIERLTISLEGRYQSERVVRKGVTAAFVPLATYNGGLTALTPIRAPDGSEFRDTFNSFLPRVSALYEFSPDLNAYATFSVGNNPGGFNTSQFARPDQLSIEEEKLFNYELGFKARFASRLSIDFAVYRMDWKNQQTTGTFFSPNDIAYAISENRGESRIYGADLGINWLTPIRGLDIRAAVGFNDGEYVNFCSTNLAALLYTLPSTATPRERIDFACVPVDGNKLEAVSKWQASITPSYSVPISQKWNAFIRGDYQYMGPQWDSEFNFAQTDAAHVLNLRVGFESDNYTVEFFARNLTNEDSPIRIARASDPFAGANNQFNQSIAFTPRLPRSFGVRASLNF